MEQFASYKSMIEYMEKNGWLSNGSRDEVKSALAAFEDAQRKRGSEAARKAMDKAAQKAW